MKNLKNIIVFIDESKEGSFLLNCVSDDIVRYEANDEIEELKSFNGTLVYKLIDENQNDELIASKTFANIAKVANGDEIYINSKIMELEESCIKYIVIHELCHLKYKTHAKSFYNLVKKYFYRI